METWRMVWQKGVHPLLTIPQLEALRKALVEDDPRLLQGRTTEPPPLMCEAKNPVECACPLAYAGWQGDGLDSVAKVESFFAARCWEADQKLGEPGAVRWLLNWIDDTPRDEMRRELLIEVQRSLSEKLGATEADRDAADRAGNLLRRA